ncbi:MAG: hypothetical protein ABI548_12690 [Polyangiaceae bacterium]
MDALGLEPSERAFLAALQHFGVRYLIIGMSAAVLQGASGVTEVVVELWVERLDEPRIGDAARAANGFWISEAFGSRPPGLGGPSLSDRFDVVTTAHGLADFRTEYAASRIVSLDGIELHVLPLTRILASKRAGNRAKDQAQIPALEAALAVERDNDRA